jgi:hypothetical protein
LKKVGGVGNGIGRKKGKNNLGGGAKQLGCRGRGWVLGGRKEKSGSAGERKKNHDERKGRNKNLL